MSTDTTIATDDPLATLAAAIPDYARDLRSNLASVLASANLTPQQVWGTAVAAAIAARNPHRRAAIIAAARPHLSEAALAAAKTAAALMGMNNVYFRFVHVAAEEAYRHLPARLRMQAVTNPGVDRADFELWALAVSAINFCAACIDAHEKHVTAHGITREGVADAVRIAAVLSGIAVALEGAEP
jgi:lipoyl-dependent peroxiredoxin subunit D